MTKGQEEEGWRMTNIVLSLLMVVMVGMVLVFILETAGIVHLVAPSYQGEQLALAVELTRILLPSMIFGTLMGVLVGINNVNNSFLAPSLIGLVANVITIVSIFVSLSALVNLCLLTAGLFVVLRQQGIQANPLQGIGKFLGQVIIAVTGMSVLVSEYLQYIGPQFSGKSGLMAVVFSAVLLGTVAYAVFAYLLRIEEVRKGAAFALRQVRRYLRS